MIFLDKLFVTMTYDIVLAQSLTASKQLLRQNFTQNDAVNSWYLHRHFLMMQKAGTVWPGWYYQDHLFDKSIMMSFEPGSQGRNTNVLTTRPLIKFLLTSINITTSYTNSYSISMLWTWRFVVGILTRNSQRQWIHSSNSTSLLHNKRWVRVKPQRPWRTRM